MVRHGTEREQGIRLRKKLDVNVIVDIFKYYVILLY